VKNLQALAREHTEEAIDALVAALKTPLQAATALHQVAAALFSARLHLNKATVRQRLFIWLFGPDLRLFWPTEAITAP
jgi:hypothetical protein